MVCLPVVLCPGPVQGDEDEHEPLGVEGGPAHEEDQNHGHCMRKEKRVGLEA